MVYARHNYLTWWLAVAPPFLFVVVGRGGTPGTMSLRISYTVVHYRAAEHERKGTAFATVRFETCRHWNVTMGEVNTELWRRDGQIKRFESLSPPFCYPTDHQAVCFLRVQKINCFINPGRRTFISYVSFEATCYWFRSVSQSYRIFTFEIGDIFLLEKSNRATVRRIITKTQQNSHHQSRKRGRESS